MKFSELGLPEELYSAVAKMGFENPTPIQEKIIPIILEKDSDVVGLAQTGTGKTAAFGLPLLAKINVKDKHPQGVIICPTRELAVQVQGDIKNYGQNMKGLNVVCVYGGASIDTQIRELKRGAQVIVGTPGRMGDLINRGVLKLDAIQHVILDEADEMLNMGFKDELDKILSETPKTKRTWLFSATMPNDVLRIAKTYMTDPIQVESGKRNQAADTVEHFAYYVGRGQMYPALKRLLDVSPGIYGVVFANTRRHTQQIAEDLIKDGYDADSLHGELSQAQRDKVMKQFKDKNLQILVATDVAARGIDVDNLSHVIHFGIPQDIEAYNHRSGRTGRAGNTGISCAIVDSRDRRKIQEISRMIGRKITDAQIPTGDEICENQLFHSIEKIKKTVVETGKIATYLPRIYEAFEDVTKEELLEKIVSKEFSAFLNYYSKHRDFNNGNEPSTERVAQNANNTRFFINLGVEDNLSLDKFKDFVALYGDLTSDHVTNVKMLDRFSFFEVDNAKKAQVLAGFGVGVEHDGRKVNIEEAQQKQRSSGGGGNRRFDNRGGSGGQRRTGGGNFSGGGQRREGGFGGQKKSYGGGERREGGNSGGGTGNFKRKRF